MDPDDLDDLLDDRKADLEARFQELEREAEIERLRQTGGAGASSPPRDPGPADAPAAPGADPLADMKAVFESDQELERYLLVVCPDCGAKNRMSLTRVRTAKPVCGRCKQDLSFTKY